jgi:hypothetical protein
MLFRNTDTVLNHQLCQSTTVHQNDFLM